MTHTPKFEESKSESRWFPATQVDSQKHHSCAFPHRRAAVMLKEGNARRA